MKSRCNVEWAGRVLLLTHLIIPNSPLPNSSFEAVAYEKVIQSYTPAFNKPDSLSLKIWNPPFFKKLLLIMG